jgi:mono/diheme cytochrome c family protein
MPTPPEPAPGCPLMQLLLMPVSFTKGPLRAWGIVLALCSLLTGVGRLTADEAVTGEQIYRKQCARCHGANGEGRKEYPHPLIGDRSVPQLAELIARTMPEDRPGTCVGADANKVAAWIHEQFYSRAAQERNKPPPGFAG